MARLLCKKRCLECCILWTIVAALIPISATANSTSLWRIMAPHINQNPPDEIIFKNHHDVRLSCQANADSNSTYSWKKDNVLLVLDNRIVLEGRLGGELVLKDPSKADEGAYQCFASNIYGTAVSTPVHLKMAFLEPFPPVLLPEYSTPLVGKSLSLRCRPPPTYPKGTNYWTYGDKALKPIPTDNRTILDYEGTLHIANVLETDSFSGTRVVCILQNSELRSLVQGSDYIIQPKVVSGSPTYYAPGLLWSTPIKDIAILGEKKNMMCIFSGLPTPEVSWKHLGQKISNDRVSFPQNRHGTVIEINQVQESDGGKYECSATNSMSNDSASSTVSKEIDLVVESRPFWNSHKEPSNVFAAEGNDVGFECDADGTPKPKVIWSVNGIPVTQLAPDPQRVMDENKLCFKNIQSTDSKVVQCVAENKHGYILKNLYLTIVGVMAPHIIQNPPAEVIFENHRDVRLSCQANADSNPMYSWKKGNILVVMDNRIVRMAMSGDLIIKNPSKADEGIYQCFASNLYGTAASTPVRLKMAFLERFPIVLTPDILTPLVGESLSLHCSPPSTYPKRIINWAYNTVSKLIPIQYDNRFLLDYEGSLHIANILNADFKKETRVVCVLQDSDLRSLDQGSDHNIQPKLVSGSPALYAPALMWSSPTKDIAVLGEKKKMKCIFSGLPTPQVSWKHRGKQISNSRVSFPEGSHGTEIEIDQVQESDGGKYECSATNSMSNPLSIEIDLAIHSRPLWNQQKKPSDIFAAEGSDVGFECEADGTPKPNITWSVNGIPVAQLASDPQRVVDGNKLIFKNVQRTDSKAVQCVAENDHGYILKNLYLTVLDKSKSNCFTDSNTGNVIRGTFFMSAIIAIVTYLFV